jgi:AraC-like DNA-binding protein
MKVAPYHLEENRLSKIISYISEHYYQSITLEEIADIASMTIPAFCRYFKKRTNKTFIQFLNEYRIGKACVLLAQNNLTITQIWCELGFNSSTNFNRSFRKLYHCTPMEYRKRYALQEHETALVL